MKGMSSTDHCKGIPSPDEVEEKRTPAGGWSKDQLAEWGVSWPPPKGWKRELERRWNEENA